MEPNTEHAIKKLSDVPETRSGHPYSPYVAGADKELEALLLRAFLIAEDSDNESPLSTPLSTPPPSPSLSPAGMPEEHNEQAPVTPIPSVSALPSPPAPSSGTVTKVTPCTQKKHIKSAAEIAREKGKSKRSRRKARISQPDIMYSRDPNSLVQQSVRSSVIHAAQAVSQMFDVQHQFHPSSSGFLGLEKNLPEKRDYTLHELVDPGGDFRFAKLSHLPESSQPLTNSTGAVMGVVIPGLQNDPSWEDNVQTANNMIERLGASAKFSPPKLTKTQQRALDLGLGGPTTAHPRRGPHKFLAYGASTGNRQKCSMGQEPKMMRQHPKNRPIMEEV
ncbi:hypothetical protein VNI00_016505 [Paramarasmius palmivorus]|uniref:Uncharacterized protein n=1 Tax=Paramarasmius palmivorus TaxID=297713 RepID=A0AAW0BF52_9AGAR